MFSAAAQIYLLFADRASFSGVNLARSTVIAFLALAYSCWAIWGAGYKPVAEGFMLLLAGIPIYIWLKWESFRDAPTSKSPATHGAAAPVNGGNGASH